MDLILVIIAATACGLLSLSVALLLLINKSLANILIKYGTPFAAGVLLVAALRDLIPEGIIIGGTSILNATLIAIVVFFLIEKGFTSFHHHHEEDLVEKKNPSQGWLFIIGDVFHNFVDGIALGAAFLVSPATGIVATVALIAHDVPLEVGEFGVQLRSGFSVRQTIVRNIVSSFTLLFGAILAFTIGESSGLQLGYVYGVIAGFFIYIALSDIVPTIHSSEKTRYGLQTLFLIVGLVFGATVSSVAHQYIDVGHDHGQEEHKNDHDNHGQEEHKNDHDNHGHEEHKNDHDNHGHEEHKDDQGNHGH